MGFNQFSKPIAQVDAYIPMSEELLTRGAMETYNRAGKLGQNLSSQKSNLFGINTYSKDAEVLNDYENQFNQQVAELTKQGITSPQAISRFNSLISNYTNNPDILAIHKRANFYNNELANEQKAYEKGEIYKSRGKKSLENYYNSGVYLTNPENVSYTQGYVAPKIRQIQEELFKNHKDEIVKKVSFLGKDGRIYTYQKVDGDAVSSLWSEAVKNDPSLSRYYQDLFEEDNEGVDWNQDGALFLQNAANNASELAERYKNNGDIENYNKYSEKAEKLSEASTSKYSGDTFKNIAFNDFVDKDASDLGNAHNSLDLEDIKADQIKLENIRTSNNLYEYGEKLKMDAGLYETNDPKTTIPRKQESSSEKQILDAEGHPIGENFIYSMINNAFNKGNTEAQSQIKFAIQKKHGLTENDFYYFNPNTKVIQYGKKVRYINLSEEQKKKYEDDGNGYARDKKTKHPLVKDLYSHNEQTIPGLFSGAEIARYEKFKTGVNQLNTQSVNSPQEQAKQFLISQGIANPNQAQIDSVIARATVK